MNIITLTYFYFLFSYVQPISLKPILMSSTIACCFEGLEEITASIQLPLFWEIKTEMLLSTFRFIDLYATGIACRLMTFEEDAFEKYLA